MNEITWQRTRCSGGDCIEVADIGAAPDGRDWFRIRSSVHTRLTLAVTGDELRAFLLAVRAGQFDELVGLEPDTTITELNDEIDVLRERLAGHHALRAGVSA